MKKSDILSSISEIIQYLEDAGLIEESRKMYEVMFDSEENAAYDPLGSNIRPDIQMNTGGPVPLREYDEGTGFRGTFSFGQKLANIANILDKKAYYEEADKLDLAIRTLMLKTI